MLELTMQIYIEDGSSDPERLPLWRSSDGAPMIPRKGELIVHCDRRYRVNEVEWNYDLEEISIYVEKENLKSNVVDDLNNATGVMTALDKYKKIADLKIDRGEIGTFTDDVRGFYLSPQLHLQDDVRAQLEELVAHARQGRHGIRIVLREDGSILSMGIHTTIPFGEIWKVY